MAFSPTRRYAHTPLRSLVVVAATIALLCSSLVPAQDARSEQWRKKREEKAKQVEPEKLGALEEKLLWFEKRGLREIINFHYKNFYPKLGTLSTGSGLSAGVRYWQPNLGRTFFDVQSSAVWSLRGYQLYDLHLGEAHRRAIGPFVLGNFSYRRLPQEDFFGLGPDSARENRTSFLLEQASYEVLGGYHFNRRVTLGGKAGLLDVNVGPGTDERFPTTQGRFSDAAAPGLARQPDFFHASSFLQIDYRDNPLNPHRGGVAQLSVGRYDDRGSQLFEFNRFTIDSRYYLPLGNETRVLALRFFSSLDDAPAGSRIPFYFQQTLGGSNELRGFREFRFRDEKLLTLSGEYRWEAASFFELALFADRGKVFSEIDQFDFKHLEKSWGFGTRFKTKRGVLVRVDVARSREGSRVFLKFEPSF